MEAWRAELDDLFDQVAEYADDWPELINQITALPLNKQTHEFLRQLVPRLKVMCRTFNRVSYDTKSRTYTIKNYSYQVYWYFKQKYPQAVITHMAISIHTDDLTDTDRDQLQKQLLSSL